ncbi:MAG: hypothetical protein ACK5LY_10820 [Lachnospirales bacterium]
MNAKQKAVIGAVTLGLTTYAMARNSKNNITKSAKKLRKNVMDMF